MIWSLINLEEIGKRISGLDNKAKLAVAGLTHFDPESPGDDIAIYPDSTTHKIASQA